MSANYKSVNCTYESLNEFLNGKQVKNLANNTKVYKNTDYEISVKYHDSIIAVLTPEMVHLSNDGFFTSTTKERLNWFINPYQFNISQVNHKWIVYKFGQWQAPIGLFNGNGTLFINPISWQGLLNPENKTREKMINRIKKFSKEYVKRLIDGKIKKPDSGDCWYCLMSFLESFDHLDSHIREKYYVPSLILKAIEFKSISEFAKWGIGYLWGDIKEDCKFTFDVLSEQAYKSLWQYMLHCYDQDNK